MNSPAESHLARQRGMVLVTSLLLLVVVTVLALAMFRSYGVTERIAGNVREKQRAVQAAVTAQQFAESWLSSSGNAGTTVVACSSVLNGNSGLGQICATPLSASAKVQVPWVVGGNQVGVDYTPTGMNTTTSGNSTYYVSNPRFHIARIGTSSSADIFAVTAVGYGASTNAVAVVESTYAVSASIGCLSCNTNAVVMQ